MSNIPNNQYLRTQVQTASKEQLVLMLFDGILRFSEQARTAIENKEIENGHTLLMRAQAIIMELIYTLDREKGGEVAENLLGLYAYCFNCLIHANMKKDTTKIDEVQKVIRGIREGWVGAMSSIGATGKTEESKAVAEPAAASQRPSAPTAQPSTPSTAATKQPQSQAQQPANKPTGYGPGRTSTMTAPRVAFAAAAKSSSAPYAQTALNLNG